MLTFVVLWFIVVVAFVVFQNQNKAYCLNLKSWMISIWLAWLLRSFVRLTARLLVVWSTCLEVFVLSQRLFGRLTGWLHVDRRFSSKNNGRHISADLLTVICEIILARIRIFNHDIEIITHSFLGGRRKFVIGKTEQPIIYAKNTLKFSFWAGLKHQCFFNLY